MRNDFIVDVAWYIDGRESHTGLIVNLFSYFDVTEKQIW